MKIPRRLVIGSLLALIPVTYLYRKDVFSDDTKFNFEHSFSTLIDTFIPTDEAPGAIDLGIDRVILEQVSSNGDYLNKVTQLLQMLHESALKKYHQPFGRTPLAQRTHLVEYFLSSREDTNAHIHLTSLRLKTMTKYYTSTAAFEMLNYHPPSQGGYPDYDSPPT